MVYEEFMTTISLEDITSVASGIQTPSFCDLNLKKHIFISCKKIILHIFLIIFQTLFNFLSSCLANFCQFFELAHWVRQMLTH